VDLTKAVLQTQTQSQTQTHTETNSAARQDSSAGDEALRHNLILVPAMFGGVLAAAATSHSLLLDAAEEVLTIYPPYQLPV
jgi:hypothetical protein